MRRCSPFEDDLASSSMMMFLRVFTASVFKLERDFGKGEGRDFGKQGGLYEEKEKEPVRVFDLRVRLRKLGRQWRSRLV